jgi:hypothetical protein
MHLVMIDLPKKLALLEKHIIILYESSRGSEKAELSFDCCFEEINEIRENIMENEEEINGTD